MASRTASGVNDGAAVLLLGVLMRRLAAAAEVVTDGELGEPERAPEDGLIVQLSSMRC